MAFELVVTSTALTEAQTKKLEVALQENFSMVRYSADLTSEVQILVINKSDPFKHWLKSKKFMYVTTYRPDVRVINFDDVCNRKKEHTSASLLKIPQVTPFEGLQISLCRLEDGLLEKIHSVIESNGGKVIHHLTNETDVMVSMVAEGKRYEAALKWGVIVVSPDWCYDSMDRGLPLNTKYYKLLQNMAGVETKLNYEGEEDRTGSERVVKTYRLGRRADACDWEKLKEWRDNEHARKLEDYIKSKIDNTEHKKDSVGTANKNSSDDTNEENYTVLDDNTTDFNSSKRDISQLDLVEDEDKVVNIKKVGKAGELWNSMMHKDKKANLKFANMKTLQNNTREPKCPILQGLKFKTIGYSSTEDEKLAKVIAKFGGKITTDPEDEVNFTVVNFKYNKVVHGHNLITELAIERFIFNEKVDAGDYLWCKPFFIDETTPVSAFTEKFFISGGETGKAVKVKVSITGFEGTDLSQMERLLKEKLSPWVEFRQTFSQACQLLVVGLSGHTNTGRLRKQQLARRWNIPALLVEDFFTKVLELSSM